MKLRLRSDSVSANISVVFAFVVVIVLGLINSVCFLNLAHATDFQSTSGKNQKAIIYFITGAPFDVQPGQIKDTTKILADFIKTNLSESAYTIQHNSKWKEICSNITKLKTANPESEIILLGHSYGAQAGITVSDCLSKKGIKVNRLVTLDTIHKTFDLPSDVIPANVDINNNFYQTSEPFLRGEKNEHRADQSEVGITNTEVKVENGNSPHFDMVKELATRGVLQAILLDELSK
jgi:hypothetical protein